MGHTGRNATERRAAECNRGLRRRRLKPHDPVRGALDPPRPRRDSNLHLTFSDLWLSNSARIANAATATSRPNPATRTSAPSNAPSAFPVRKTRCTTRVRTVAVSSCAGRSGPRPSSSTTHLPRPASGAQNLARRREPPAYPRRSYGRAGPRAVPCIHGRPNCRCRGDTAGGT